jgi:hypothetical protein
MTEIPIDVRVLLEKHAWNESIPRLLRHANNKIQRRRWRGSFGGNPPGGIEADDVVQTEYYLGFADGIQLANPIFSNFSGLRSTAKSVTWFALMRIAGYGQRRPFLRKPLSRRTNLRLNQSY